jgi:ABC-type transport system involved in cytochrome c biogenesis permease subunit
MAPAFWGIISAVLLLLVVVLAIPFLPNTLKQKIQVMLGSWLLVFTIASLVILKIPSPGLPIQYFLASFIVTIFVTLVIGLIIACLFPRRSYYG